MFTERGGGGGGGGAKKIFFRIVSVISHGR